MTNLLTLDDIADLRAYERERAAFRARIVELKQRRRVELGPFVTLLFENRDTVRYQIQEMARVEKLITDADIQSELDTYNPLVSRPGRLCATLFIELTDDTQMRRWLPALVGIERSVVLCAGSVQVRCRPEEQHARQLTRSHVTSAVHFLVFDVDAAVTEAFAASPVEVVCDHPAYSHSARLPALTVAELLADLEG
jgi:hypothetical protein